MFHCRSGYDNTGKKYLILNFVQTDHTLTD
jgi:hypothetical protein